MTNDKQVVESARTLTPKRTFASVLSEGTGRPCSIAASRGSARGTITGSQRLPQGPCETREWYRKWYSDFQTSCNI